MKFYRISHLPVFTGKGASVKPLFVPPLSARRNKASGFCLSAPIRLQNVGQVFSQTIGNNILPVASVPGLSALEIDPCRRPGISGQNR